MTSMPRSQTTGKPSSERRGAAFLLVCLLTAHGLAAAAEFAFDGQVLTIQTARYQIQWQNGSMIGLKTLVPVETDVAAATHSMRVEQLPNGLGSLHGAEEQAVEQHHPWTHFTLDTTFPAQHPPHDGTQTTFEPNAAGGCLTYTGLAGDPESVLVQEFRVEPESGDLVLKQHGRSPHPGVFGLGWSILNLRQDLVLATPYFGGQHWYPDYGKDKILSAACGSVFWGADIIVAQVPAGGCFGVWAENAHLRPTYYRRYNDGNVQALNFQENGSAPYDDNTTATSCAWHFNTHPGHWTQAARSYRQWMIRTFGMTPRRQRASAWVDDIALVWPKYVHEPSMKQMAELIDPKKVLLMNWGWLDGFNRRIPEYAPKAGEQAAAQSALAHKYGYRLGIYTSMALVDVETHPTMMQDYGLDFFYRAPWQEKPTEPKGWLVYVHPGSAKWREFYASKMAEVHQKYGIDYLYQDVAGCSVASSGLVEGKTFNEGVIACEAAIREQSPEVALGGEYWTRVNAIQEDFGVTGFLAWGDEAHKEFIGRPHQPHALLSFLFSEFCTYWPHNIPIRNTVKFHRSQNICEVIGGIPVWTTTLDDRVSEARVTLERAKLWAEGFRPHFPERWQADAVAYMRNPEGRLVKYLRPKQSSYCYEETPEGDRLRYARVTGETRPQFAFPVQIDGWAAFAPDGPIGLDPDRWYCVFSGASEHLPLRLTAIPDTATVQDTRVCDSYCLVALAGSGSGTVVWQAIKPGMKLLTTKGVQPQTAARCEVSLPAALLFAHAPPQSVTPGESLLLDQWQCRIISDGLVLGDGKVKPRRTFKFGDRAHDGYQVFPPAGGKGSELSIDGFIQLPDDPETALVAKLGRYGGKGDGVHFVVRVNGLEVWRHLSECKRGWEDARVPLGDYAGKPVVLSLALDCGPAGFHLSCDEAIWGDARLTVQ